MKRRTLLQSLLLGSGFGFAWLALRTNNSGLPPIKTSQLTALHIQEHDKHVVDQLLKTRRFDDNFTDDVYLPVGQHSLFKSTLQRMLAVQKLVGYANFALLGFDDMLKYASAYPVIGSFTSAEIAFLDEVFSSDARRYGFHGSKVITSLTSEIDKASTIKVAGSGQYLFQGEALHTYKKLRKEIGEDLILTSGVRGVVKQMTLFLNKLAEADGNLSRASRSLAPPGHSYHGIGDFDVGKRGLGKLNFTQEFSRTSEFQKLIELEYIDIRYTTDNQFGVRYEPWHIKVV